WINPHKAPFTDPNARLAAQYALDRGSILRTVYASGAVTTDSVDLPGALPTQYGGRYNIPFNLSPAKALLNRVPPNQRTAPIVFVYKTDDVTNSQLAGVIAQKLRAAGFNVTTRGVVLDTFDSYHTAGESKRPEMLLDNGNPDDADAAAGATLWWTSDPKSGI